MVQEECAELIAAINQHARGRLDAEAVRAEIADVYITLAQAWEVFGEEEVALHILAALERLERRIGYTVAKPPEGGTP
jgi:NTP pyrophosphatase (non-canonical NTP hydrolase)